MKTNVKIWLIMTAFYLVATTGYVIWGMLSQGYFEIIGTAAMAMLFLMSAFLAFYLWKTDRTQGLVPEDRPDANIEDGESEMGFYSPWSWWPFYLGIGAAITFASLAIGWWLFFLGVPLGIVGLVGFVFEYSRGQHAH